LLGKRYKEEKKAVGENQYTLPKQTSEENISTALVNNSHSSESKENLFSGVETVTTPKKTEQKIAEQAKVSPKTVRNAEKFTEAVDKVAQNVGVNPQEIL
jgi:transaldolase